MNVGASLYGALTYNGQKVNEGEGKLLLSNKIFDDGTGTMDIARAASDFERYLPQRMRTEKPIIHISLNPHPDDKLTDTELSDIAREYMEKSVTESSLTSYSSMRTSTATTCISFPSVSGWTASGWTTITSTAGANVPPTHWRRSTVCARLVTAGSGRSRRIYARWT